MEQISDYSPKVNVLMKRILIFIIITIHSILCFSQEFEFNGIFYNILDRESHICETRPGYITYNPRCTHAGNELSREIEIPEVVTYEGEEFKVVKIGEFGFFQTSDLHSIKLSDAIIEIGQNAFRYSGLKTVQMGSSIALIGASAFYQTPVTDVIIPNINVWCNIKFEDYNSNPLWFRNATLTGCQSTVLELPEGLCQINNYAFAGLASLEELKIPCSVSIIGEDAFHSCVNLKSLSFEDSNKEIFIPENAFYQCPIENLYLGRTLQFEETYSSAYPYGYKTPFSSLCDNIQELTIGPNVSLIQTGLFQSSKHLSTIKVLDAPLDIKDHAFHYCIKLKDVDFGRRIISIGNDAFSSTKELYNIILPEDLVFIGERAFCMSGVRNVSFENSKLALLNSVFQDCYDLESVDFGDNIIHIGEKSFEWCTALKKVTFPINLLSIGEDAFSHCANLQKACIPKAVQRIGMDAFSYCERLDSLIVEDAIESQTLSMGQIFRSPIKYMYMGRNIEFQQEGLWNTELNNLVVGNLVTKIQGLSFRNCENLKNVLLGSKVEKIGMDAFRYCPIENLIIPPSVKYIDSFSL